MTPALWDPDDLMLSMQETIREIDREGSRLADLHAHREERRRAQLEALVDGTGFTTLQAEALLQAQSAELMRRPSRAPSPAAPYVSGEGGGVAAAVAAAVAPAAEAAAAAAAAAAEVDALSHEAAATPPLSLCVTCLDRYISSADLAALLRLEGPLSAIGIRRAANADGDTALGSDAPTVAQTLFEVLDLDQSKAISLRQLLLAFSKPSDALKAAATKAGLAFGPENSTA